MNGAIKFHKATGPAFQPGEIWVDSAGHHVRIIKVTPYNENPVSLIDYEVEYTWVFDGVEWDAVTWSKDAWNFQVRHNHIADMHARK